MLEPGQTVLVYGGDPLGDPAAADSFDFDGALPDEGDQVLLLTPDGVAVVDAGSSSVPATHESQRRCPYGVTTGSAIRRTKREPRLVPWEEHPMHHLQVRPALQRLVLAVALVAMAGVVTGEAVSAQSPPNRVFGTATLNGSPAPAGTVVTAFVDGRECGRGTVDTDNRYFVDVASENTVPGCGREGAPVTFRVGDAQAAQTVNFTQGTFTALDLTAPAPAQPTQRYSESYLDLSDSFENPRPCVPPMGQVTCDATRAALWRGDAAAWAQRGVTDDDERFIQIVLLRVEAGDPAVISNIAKIIGNPYLKVTRIGYAAGAEFAEVTNLGSGPQEMNGWTLRSPNRNQVFTFPSDFTLAGGQSCRVYSGAVGANPCGTGATFNAGDVWPDDSGRAVLFFDLLALPGDDTLYNANPATQPPPPNLIGDPSTLR